MDFLGERGPSLPALGLVKPGTSRAALLSAMSQAKRRSRRMGWTSCRAAQPSSESATAAAAPPSPADCYWWLAFPPLVSPMHGQQRACTLVPDCSCGRAARLPRACRAGGKAAAAAGCKAKAPAFKPMTGVFKPSKLRRVEEEDEDDFFQVCLGRGCYLRVQPSTRGLPAFA